jgi:butyryl-CoA dehydrogenase
MITTLSEDHRMLIDGVREYARGELLSRDRQWDRSETSCCELLEQFAQMGLLGLRVPEELGGLGCPMLPYAQIIRELAYASPAVAVTISVHSMVCEAVRMYAAPRVRDEILRRLTSPDNLSAFAISEPDAGSDPASARTRAERVEGGWRLFGSKMWVTNGLTGRWFVVLARTNTQGTHRDLSMFLMDARQAGVQRSPIHGKMGIRGSETAEMALDGAFVPEQNLLGQVGEGMRVALSALDGGRIGIAAQALGIAQACLDEMISYARQRRQFDRPIADFQAIQWMIADSATEIAAAELLMEQAALLKDAGRPFTRQASMAKLFATEAANRIAYRAVQIHGGSGFVNEFRVEQLYRDVRVTTIYEGTSEIQRLVIARSLLREN